MLLVVSRLKEHRPPMGPGNEFPHVRCLLGSIGSEQICFCCSYLLFYCWDVIMGSQQLCGQVTQVMTVGPAQLR